jgi:uncharacterized lipoprotein YajG
MGWMLLGMLTGCGYVPEKVALSYEPMLVSEPPLAAAGKQIGITVADHRRGGKEVSRKKGDHGIERAAIRLKGNLADDVERAVQLELSQLGYVVGTGTVRIEIEIHKFYNDFKQGFFTDRGVSELFLGVHVLHRDGRILFSKNIIGLGEKGGVWVQSGKHAKHALEAALSDAIYKLVKDPSFQQALKQ